MLILISHKTYLTEEDLVVHGRLLWINPLLDKNIILRNICIKMVHARDKQIIIREKLIRFSLHFQRYISCFRRLCINATLVAMEFKSAYVTKRVILALKLGNGLSILSIRFSVLGGLSPNRRNINMTGY